MKKWLIPAACIAVVIALALFQPWRLLTSSSADEAIPGAPAATTDSPDQDATPSQDASSPSPSPASASPASTVRPSVTTPAMTPTLLAQGDFIAAEHPTTGRALIIHAADGKRYLRLESLASSDGPDLHVWLSDQPSGGAWGSYDDARFLALGPLKATHGNQNYEIPAEADLSGLSTAVIWCDRFNVAFGTAALVA